MRENYLEKGIIIFGLTVGISSYIIYAGGLIRLLNISINLATAFLLTGLVFSIILIFRFFLNNSVLNKFALGAFFFLAGFYFSGIFSPVLEIDSLAYHLYLPKIFLRADSIYFDIYNGNSLFPLLLENLFAIGIKYNYIALCKAITYLIFMFLALGIISFFYYFFNDKKYIVPGLFILLSVPGIVTNSIICYNDIGMTFFADPGYFNGPMGMRQPVEVDAEGLWCEFADDLPAVIAGIGQHSIGQIDHPGFDSIFYQASGDGIESHGIHLEYEGGGHHIGDRSPEYRFLPKVIDRGRMEEDEAQEDPHGAEVIGWLATLACPQGASRAWGPGTATPSKRSTPATPY